MTTRTVNMIVLAGACLMSCATLRRHPLPIHGWRIPIPSKGDAYQAVYVENKLNDEADTVLLYPRGQSLCKRVS